MIFTEPLQVESLSLKIAGLPKSLDGLRLVQLSDFHYDGLRLSDQLLRKAIQFANAAEPDLILLTGDFITHEPEPIYQLITHLKHLRSQVGIYAILGNHDYYYARSEKIVIQALEQIGIPVLSNQVIYLFDQALALVGLPDLFSGKFQPKAVMDQIPADIPRVVLSHNPDTAVHLQQWRVDLQLSGHTHGGQVVLPNIGPLPGWLQDMKQTLPDPFKFLIPIKSDCRKLFRHWEWASGLHQVGDNLLYVNRGLGTYFPGRWNCPPEVTMLTLKSG
ncbi:MAG: metallophosphoesterase [Microcoleaceae cyanobacterium]